MMSQVLVRPETLPNLYSVPPEWSLHCPLTPDSELTALLPVESRRDVPAIFWSSSLELEEHHGSNQRGHSRLRYGQINSQTD